MNDTKEASDQLQAHRVRRAIERHTLRTWLLNGCSLAEIADLPTVGLVGNKRAYSDRTKRQFQWLWTWSTVRLEGASGAAQDKLYNRRGSAALNRRIARVSGVIGHLRTFG